MSGVGYDDSNLQRLFAEMESKVRIRTMKGAFRRAANKVRKVAVSNLRAKMNSNRELERGVRALVWKRKAGFRVTVGTKKANKKGKGEAGYYISRKRRGKSKATGKPVLMWAELGTAQRTTKSKTRIFTRSRKGHNTGRMKRYGFMADTVNQLSAQIGQNLKNEIIENIKRTIKRYGCT